MKIWLKRNRRWIVTVAVVVALAIAFTLGSWIGANDTNQKAYAAAWQAISTLPEPERCVLCGSGQGMKYHAPCLVNLSTGEVGEMRIYTPDLQNVGEIAPEAEQQTGTFGFLTCAGLTGIMDTSNHTCEVTLPAEKQMINPGHFCQKCRGILAGAGMEGYVLVDLYHLEDIKAYPIYKNAEYIIRDYLVSVSFDYDANALVLKASGMLY